MNLTLERGDLLQMDPISHKGTLKLLPLGKKNKQKLVIADDSGQVSCYEFKKGEPQVVFQLKVFDGPVTCVALGGNTSKKDKIFVSHSQRIVGITKKGKDFFKLASSLTETISNISVEDTRIWTGCEFVYNLYDNGKDTAYFICKDQINDLIVAHVTRDSDYDAVLACRDSCIRIIHGSEKFVEIPTQSAVTAVAFSEIESDIKATKSPTALVYALETGVMGVVRIFPSGEYDYLWSIDDGIKRSPITCIALFDINKDKVNEIIVGRDDGRLEVYKQDSILSEPFKVFSKDIGESIRSVECGFVNSSDFSEVIIAGYSGKVISFTTEPVYSRAQEDNYGRSIQTINNENRIKHMRSEVDGLKKKLEKEREKLKKTEKPSTVTQIKPANDFSINSKFVHDPDLAAYVLTIELQTPIDLVILRSSVILDLVETDTGTSVLSVTPPELQTIAPGEEALSKYVAVFRCQSQEKRILLNLRTNEGEYGDLLITVVAASAPKAAKIIKYDLKPLSLHTKVHVLQEDESVRPRNSVRYSGNLQLSVLHEWAQAIFPDVPPRLDEGTNEQRLTFRNSFTGAIAVCEIKRNEMIIESESASTIAIVKENITRLANYRRVTLEEHMSTNDSSIASFLTLIRSKLDHQLSLSRKILLVDAIQEIAMMKETADHKNSNWLSTEYNDILLEQETIRKEFKARDKSLEYLSGIITDLYVDWNKLQGIDARHRIPQVIGLIHEGNFENLVHSFLAYKHK
eukprot:gene7245-9877_t